MKVRIEAVISTAGNDEAYVGHHLGLHLIGRPLTSMVVTFMEEMTPVEYWRVRDIQDGDMSKLSTMFRMGPNALQIHSFKTSITDATTAEMQEFFQRKGV